MKPVCPLSGCSTNTRILRCIYHGAVPRLDTSSPLASLYEFMRECVFCLYGARLCWLKLHSSNVCSSPASLSLNTETVTGSGSGSVWQAYREIGWVEGKTRLCSSTRSWNPRKWMEPWTRHEQEEQLALEPKTYVCLSACINQSVAAP